MGGSHRRERLHRGSRSSSGASNLAQIRTGGELHLVVDEVPSGTYFVHVRATNHVGTTAPSAELTVVAP